MQMARQRGAAPALATGMTLVMALLLTLAGGPVEALSPAAEPPDSRDPPGVDDCLTCHGREAVQGREREGAASMHHSEAPVVDPAVYDASVHGIISCVRCHAEVTDRHLENPAEPLPLPASARERRALISAQCLKCHAGLYEESYRYSFHGIAVESGDLRAATCVDCHGVHNVFPAADPRSTVAPAAIPATCGQSGCHQGVPDSWADRTEHHLPTDRAAGGITWWVWKFFVALILFDVMKDGPIVMFDLLRRLRS